MLRAPRKARTWEQREKRKGFLGQKAGICGQGRGGDKTEIIKLRHKDHKGHAAPSWRVSGISKARILCRECDRNRFMCWEDHSSENIRRTEAQRAGDHLKVGLPQWNCCSNPCKRRWGLNKGTSTRWDQSFSTGLILHFRHHNGRSCCNRNKQKPATLLCSPAHSAQDNAPSPHPPRKNHPAPNVIGATAEKPWDRKKFKTYWEALWTDCVQVVRKRGEGGRTVFWLGESASMMHQKRPGVFLDAEVSKLVHSGLEQNRYLDQRYRPGNERTGGTTVGITWSKGWAHGMKSENTLLNRSPEHTSIKGKFTEMIIISKFFSLYTLKNFIWKVLTFHITIFKDYASPLFQCSELFCNSVVWRVEALLIDLPPNPSALLPLMPGTDHSVAQQVCSYQTLCLWRAILLVLGSYNYCYYIT